MELPRDLQRVALMPVFFSEYDSQVDGYLDENFEAGLARQRRFEVVSVSRDELKHWIGETQVDSSKPLPMELFPLIQHHIGAQAVIFVEIQHFNHYQPISVGIRAKLVDLSSGEILWAVDDIYNSGEPAVLQGAQHFHEANSQNTIPDKLDKSYLNSPRRFTQFVAASLFQTLPNRFSL